MLRPPLVLRAYVLLARGQSYPLLHFSAAVGRLPNSIGLVDIPEIGATPPASQSDQAGATSVPSLTKDDTPVTVGAGLPPVPGKLVKRIEAGHFIDMGELLPGYLSLIGPSCDEDGLRTPKQKHKPVTSIIE